MIWDGKYAISRHSQYFVAAGASMQQTLGEGKTEEREAPLICLWLHLFVSKKQEENHKSHNLQVSFARDTLEGSTSHCGRNLVTRLNSLGRMECQGTMMSAPAPPGSSFLIPFFQYLLVASAFSVGFSFFLLPLLVHPGLSSGKKILPLIPAAVHSLFFISIEVTDI